MSADRLYGLRVVLSPHMTETRARPVRRTLRERLFSWPWRPRQKWRKESYQVASRSVIRHGDTLHMHPDMWEEIKKQLK